jgi:hypothetical protein
MTLYELTVPVFVKQLKIIDAWLDKTVAHAEELGIDADRFMDFRLAPDQFDLKRQIQASADAAKYTVARVTGTTPPSHPDTEKTVDELRARLATAVAFVESVTPEAFEGAEDRLVPLPFLPGKGSRGRNYVIEMQLPNFWFHVMTTYAILRHNGVAIGKRDFIGSLTLEDV